MGTNEFGVLLKPFGGAYFDLVIDDTHWTPEARTKFIAAVGQVCTTQRGIFRKRYDPASGKRKLGHSIEATNYLQSVDDSAEDHVSTYRFPSGWLKSVITAVTHPAVTSRVHWGPIFNDATRQKMKAARSTPLRPQMLKPRYYQDAAVDIFVSQGIGTFAHTTGAGKTFTAAMMIHCLEGASDGAATVLYMVPSIELMHQTARKFEEWGVCGGAIGRMGDGLREPGKCTIAVVNTLWNGLSDEDPRVLGVLNSSMLIADECHLTGAVVGRPAKGAKRGPPTPNTWFKVAMACSAWYRVGFTATPGPEGDPDRRLLEGVTGPVVHTVSTNELVKAGFLAKPRVHIYPVLCETILSSWQAAYDVGITGNEYRNELIAKLAIEHAAKGQSVLITVRLVKKHGAILRDLIERRGGKVNFVSGASSRGERDKAKEQFVSRDVPILIGTIFKLGVDIPEMDVIILADALGAKDAFTIQRIGRVLRKAPGKDEALIIDFTDNDGGSFLSKWARLRRRVFVSEEAYEIEDKEREVLEDAE